MLAAVNSDLAGQILGQVHENVDNSDTGEHLLMPWTTRRAVGRPRRSHTHVSPMFDLTVAAILDIPA